jgi:nitrite reductase (NADH) small subunit
MIDHALGIVEAGANLVFARNSGVNVPIDLSKVTLIKVGTTADIPKGEGRCFEIESAAGGRRIAVFHLEDGSFRAIDQRCPHRGGPLSDGLLGGEEVICPLHSQKINLSTGAVSGSEQVRVQVYPVRIEGERVMLELRDASESG